MTCGGHPCLLLWTMAELVPGDHSSTTPGACRRCGRWWPTYRRAATVGKGGGRAQRAQRGRPPSGLPPEVRAPAAQADQRSRVARGFRDQRYRRAAHGGMVEVGTALAGRPPHSSGRAELPHPALALGLTLARCDTARRMCSRSWYISLLRPCVRDMWPCCSFPLAGRLPSIPSAPFGLFGNFVGTMQPSDCPRSFIIGLRP